MDADRNTGTFMYKEHQGIKQTILLESVFEL